MDIKELKVESAVKQNHPWEYARFHVICALISKYIKKISPNSSCIDIGCGDIFFLTSFYKKYKLGKPIAVDLAFDEEIIEQLKMQHENIPIAFYNHIDKIPKEEKASIVFLMDVIEHIEKDELFLRELAEKCFVDKETLFVITVPAFNSLYSKHDEWIGHYRRYTQKLLQTTISNAGYQTLNGGYFFFSLLAPRFVIRIIEKLKRSQTEMKGAGDWNGGKFSSFIFETILRTDFHITRFFSKVGIKLPGLSTYVICKLKK